MTRARISRSKRFGKPPPPPPRKRGPHPAETRAKISATKLARAPPPKACSVVGCENLAKSRGWCDKHWFRWHHHGDPTYLVPPEDRVQHLFACSICNNNFASRASNAKYCYVCFDEGHDERRREILHITVTKQRAKRALNPNYYRDSSQHKGRLALRALEELGLVPVTRDEARIANVRKALAFAKQHGISI